MKITKNMKRIMAFILILILLIFLPGLILTPAFVTKHNLGVGRNAVYSRIANEPDNTIDVLVMGDSESYSSVSPMQLWKDKGYTVYAAGQPGANLGDTLSVLKVALKTQQPKVILLESHSLFRNRKSKAVQKQSAIAEKMYSLFPALRYHNGWKLLFPQRLNKHYKGFNVSGRCRAYRGSLDYMTAGKTKNKRKLPDTVEPANIRDLERIREICQQNGIQLVLYSAPSPKNYNYRRTARISEISKKYDLKYVDLNIVTKTMGIDWNKDTRDKGDHLNISGAMKTTTYMGDYLEKNFDLPDHRGNALIAENWDKMYRTYEAVTAKKLQKIHEGTPRGVTPSTGSSCDNKKCRGRSHSEKELGKKVQDKKLGDKRGI